MLRVSNGEHLKRDYKLQEQIYELANTWLKLFLDCDYAKLFIGTLLTEYIYCHFLTYDRTVYFQE